MCSLSEKHALHCFAVRKNIAPSKVKVKMFFVWESSRYPGCTTLCSKELKLPLAGLSGGFYSLSFSKWLVLRKASLDPESVGSSTELCGCPWQVRTAASWHRATVRECNVNRDRFYSRRINDGYLFTLKLDPQRVI
jgi:hypothetical protein